MRKRKNRKKRPVVENIDLHRTLRAISIDLGLAISSYETFAPTGQDVSLIVRVTESGLYSPFKVISDSLHQSVVVTLCRIWDTRSDTADLNSVAHAFRNAKVIGDLAASGHTIDPGQLSNWLSDIGAVNRSGELLALKKLRHKGIAHRETPNLRHQPAGQVRGAVYGDERIIIEKTIPLVEQASAFIGYSYENQYADKQRIMKEEAVKFWEQVSTTTA
jgi:hypothetical protein